MTELEASEKISDFAMGITQGVSSLALWMAVQALEKQIPKSIVAVHESVNESVNDEEMALYGTDARFGSCPACGELVASVWNECYCGDCGQKLDWGCKNERE